ncbi:MAG: hypothetical protein IKJ35_08935 [Clostridia bacterium]|nr:hypothetical protein [Clostridia bacterium]
MALSIEQIMQLAQRARLTLSEEEAKVYADDIGDLEKMSSALLPFFGSLGDVEDDPTPLSEMREDRVGVCLPRERLLALSSERERNCIAVPCAVKEA